jgi:tetratricopeptide (TPR) repeat protein
VREIEVGARIDQAQGLYFFGVEQVNGLLNCGGKVTAIEPGGAYMQKLGEADGNVRLALSGCNIKVMIDDSTVDSSPAKLEHDRLYREGSGLIQSYMHLVGREHRPAASGDARGQLEGGIAALQKAIAILPANWSAWWIIGKAYQALGDSEKACEAFEKAFMLHKGNADVAREYMFECLRLGKADKGIAAAEHAIRLKPDDAGLLANLALAYLIGGRLEEAAQAVEKSLAISPHDPITQNLKHAIVEVQAGRRPQPKSIAEMKAG